MKQNKNIWPGRCLIPRRFSRRPEAANIRLGRKGRQGAEIMESRAPDKQRPDRPTPGKLAGPARRQQGGQSCTGWRGEERGHSSSVAGCAAMAVQGSDQGSSAAAHIKLFRQSASQKTHQGESTREWRRRTETRRAFQSSSSWLARSPSAGRSVGRDGEPGAGGPEG